MYRSQRILVVIPALNEAPALPHVLQAVPEWVDRVVVADNGSTDATADVAERWGAVLVREPRRGYGRACLAALTSGGDSDIVVFLDGDYSDRPAEMGNLLDPICDAGADLVIGSRTLGCCEPGAMPLHQRLGNRATTALLALVSGVRFTDLGPFRCIRTPRLHELSMQDVDYGWNVEMQIKAALRGLKVVEVPVSYCCRIGHSKISGSLLRSLAAGLRMNRRLLLEAYRHREVRELR